MFNQSIGGTTASKTVKQTLNFGEQSESIYTRATLFLTGEEYQKFIHAQLVREFTGVETAIDEAIDSGAEINLDEVVS